LQQQQQYVLQAAAGPGAGYQHLVPVQLLQGSVGQQSPEAPLQLLVAPAGASPGGGLLWGGAAGAMPLQGVPAAGLGGQLPQAATDGMAGPVGVYIAQNQGVLMSNGSVLGVSGTSLGGWPQSAPQPPGLTQDGRLLDASCMVQTTSGLVAPPGTLMGQAPLLGPVAWAPWDGSAGPPAPSGPMALAAGLQQLVLQPQYGPMGPAASVGLPPGW
jgi:hypothetical protein